MKSYIVHLAPESNTFDFHEKTNSFDLEQNKHACLGRFAVDVVPGGANFFGSLGHSFHRLVGSCGKECVGAVHVDEVFRARLVPEKSVLSLDRHKVSVERIDEAASKNEA